MPFLAVGFHREHDRTTGHLLVFADGGGEGSEASRREARRRCGRRFRSPVFRNDTPAQQISVPIAGVKRLALIVEKERRIEGIIFLGNTTMDLGFASVEWTREWVQKVGNTRL
jgi:hypothetical protein